MRLIAALSLCLALAACGESRLNPLNWFGGEREERIRVTDVEERRDPRPLVSEVLSIAIEPTTAGAILTATALTSATGYWQPALIEVERGEDGVVYEFRAAPPPPGTVAGPEPTRRITAAVDISSGELARIRTVTVVAATNRRSVTRR